MQWATTIVLAGTVITASAAGPAAPRIQPLDGTSWTTNDLRTFANHPDLIKGVLPFLSYIAGESTLPPRHRELLILRTVWLSRSAYQWARHAPAAREAGISRDEIRRIAAGPADRGWDPFERALLRSADELHVNSFVGDATWSTLAARYDTHQIMDAVFTVAEFTMLSEITNASGAAIEAGVNEPLPDVPYKIDVTKSGERLVGKTPRIAALAPEQWTAEVRALLDPSGSGRAVAGVYRTYAQHPKMYAPRQRLSEYIRLQATLEPRVRELLIMRIGWLCGSEYEWGAHAPAGRRAGMTDADVSHVIAGPPRTGGTFDDALLRAVDELYADDTLSDATWQELSARLNTKQLLDLLVTTGGYRMVSMSLNAFGVQLEPGAERFPATSSSRDTPRP